MIKEADPQLLTIPHRQVLVFGYHTLFRDKEGRVTSCSCGNA